MAALRSNVMGTLPRFLTNPGYILLLLGQDPYARTRDLADALGISERAAQTILEQHVAAGLLHPIPVGRRRCFRVPRDLVLPELGLSLGTLLDLLAPRTLSPPPPALAKQSANEAVRPDDRDDS